MELKVGTIGINDKLKIHKNMKLKIFTMFSVSLLVLGSCNEQDEVGRPVQIGDEISFGISAPQNEINTRTWYDTPKQDDEGNWYFPVNWEDNDEIAIFCPQASQPASKLVNYKITPDEEYPNRSAAVTRIGDVGLQWGTGDENGKHRFFGFYPASAVIDSDPNTQSITAEVPFNQKVVDWTTDANGNIVGTPDTDFAYMYAFAEVNKDDLQQGDDIPLIFHPLLTILEIEVNGPAETSAQESVTVSNVNVEGIGEGANLALAGEFTCSLDQTHGTIGECHPVENDKVKSLISIPCFDDNGTPDDTSDDKFIEIPRGKSMKIKAFIIPDSDNPIEPRSLRIRVSVMGGAAKSKTLQTADIVPKKVNRVRLPALEANNESNNWMSSIPSGDTYITELSLPGSKFSVLTPDNCQNRQVIHQNASIQEQFNAGVRAFIIQTGCDASYKQNIAHDFRGGELYVAADDVRLSLKVADVLKELTTVLNNAAEKEFVFVQLTLSASASSTDLNDWDGAIVYKNWTKAWLNTIEYQIKNVYMKDPNIALYTGEITNNTVINDVKHKIILRISYNNDSDKEYISSSDLPALFQWWKGAYQPDGINMPWGSPNNVATMKSSYLEVTSVGDGGEISKEDKEKYIKELFQKSVDMYLENTEHNILFMVDLGGYYTAGKDPKQLALDMNALGVSELQKRGNNAGLGIVLMNFADRRDDSGKKYKSDWLLQTVVDNNFKFGMREKVSSTTRTYNAEYTDGGNAIGWE